MKAGVLVVNLGTPDQPEPKEVGKFLREFLMDPEVITAPFLVRWMLVNALIVPRRRYSSAENYKKVWMKDGKGSPLLHYSQELVKKVGLSLESPAVLGMRYGNPSIGSALKSLKDQGCTKVVVFPMFPQYSSATTKTAFDQVANEVLQLDPNMETEFIESYSSDGFYVEAQSEIIREAIEGKEIDHHILSFHGLPESILKKQDPTKSHCLKSQNCCEVACQKKEEDSDVFDACYRAQCLDTAKAISEELEWSQDQWTMTFQSRLGPTKWTTPATSETVIGLAKKGFKRLSIACPAFTTDCLETLEEIAIGLKEDFLEAGGEELVVVPCLNDHQSWVRGISRTLSRSLKSLSD